MFEQTFVNTSAQTRRPWTVAVSVALQTGLVAIAFLAPLMHIAILQKPDAVPVWLPPQILKRAAEPETKPVAARVPVADPAPLRHSLGCQRRLSFPKTIAIAADAPGNREYSLWRANRGFAGVRISVRCHRPASATWCRNSQTATAIADHADSCQWRRAVGEAGLQSQTVISAARENGSRTGHGEDTSHHRPRWRHSKSASAERAASVG